jgi:hypothetical protein
MNTIVWATQILVAIALTVSGLVILLMPKQKLASKLSWVKAYSDGMRYFICVVKILGAIGLIFPFYLNIFPILTPVAAASISVFMLFAMRYHLTKKEYKDVPATMIFFVLALFILYNRI